ncbi:MAG: hypothetical protein ABMA15_12020 [Vicinamibacterales bacterium]
MTGEDGAPKAPQGNRGGRPRGGSGAGAKLREFYFTAVAAGIPEYVEQAEARVEELEEIDAGQRTPKEQAQLQWLKALLETPLDGPPQG